MDGTVIEFVCDKLQWLLEHPEVTWSGSGIYALSLTGSAVLVAASCVFRRKKKSSMDNKFDNSGGEQSIAQGDHAIGKQVNNYFGQTLKPRTLVIVALLGAGLISASLVSWHWLTPSIVVTGDKGSEQNIAQGDHVIGKQVNNYGVPLEKYEQIKKELDVSDAVLTSFFKILEQGKVPREDWGVKLPEIAFRYKELLQRFESVTSDDPQVKSLKEQAGQAIKAGEYDRAEDLLNQAKKRDRAAIATLKSSIAEQQAALEQRQLSEAQSCVSQAELQEMQYRYEKAAQYFQEAAAALPEGHEAERAYCLNAAGYDLDNIARYAEALSLYEQSLSIYREIGDRNGEATLLNNISAIYQAQGEYSKALDYLEQSLLIYRKVGDKKGEGMTLNNIGQIYLTRGDYPKALKYLEQSLLLQQEIQDKKGEGWSLNNIGAIHNQQGNYAAALQYYNQALTVSREIKDKWLENTCLNNIGAIYYAQKNYDAALEQFEQSLVIVRQISDRRNEGGCLSNIAAIYDAKGDYPTALKQYEQALAIAEEIGAKAEEEAISWNISLLYAKQDKLAEAEQYLSRTVELKEKLEAPDVENYRKLLEDVRAKLRAQQE